MNTTKQPDQASHSPLPWSIDPQGYGTPWNIDSVNGEKVALCIEGIGGKAEARNARRSANAAFIVRACNEYESLKYTSDLAVNELRDLRDKYAKLWEQRHNAKAHAQRLADALKELIGEYWCNKGEPKNEFIACITPNTIPAYWRRADKALAQWEKDKQ